MATETTGRTSVAGSELPPVEHTMAGLAARAAANYSERPAVRFRRGDGWATLSFGEVGESVREIALGMIEAGVAQGDRVCILANTRPEWTVASLAISAAGAVVVPIYPTNSAEECAWVAGNSGATMVVCEGPEQVAKIEEVRDQLPELATIASIDEGGETTLEELRERGGGADAAELERRQ